MKSCLIKHETKRLLIREATLDDCYFIFDLLNSPHWIKHIGDRGIKVLQDARRYIQNTLLDSYRLNGFGMYVVELKERTIPLGLCGFLKRDELEYVDIGFAILPEHAGLGYTFEAAYSIIKNSNFEVIYGITSQINMKSQKLLEKLGLRYIRSFQFSNYEDESLLYSNEKA